MRQKPGNPALISLATRIVIYAIAAASLNLILGYGGLVSFGHAAYFGIGAYAVGILYFHFSDAEPFLGFIPAPTSFSSPLRGRDERDFAFSSARFRSAPPDCSLS